MIYCKYHPPLAWKGRNIFGFTQCDVDPTQILVSSRAEVRVFVLQYPVLRVRISVDQITVLE